MWLIIHFFSGFYFDFMSEAPIFGAYYQENMRIIGDITVTTRPLFS